MTALVVADAFCSWKFSENEAANSSNLCFQSINIILGSRFIQSEDVCVQAYI